MILRAHELYTYIMSRNFRTVATRRTPAGMLHNKNKEEVVGIDAIELADIT